MQILTHFFSNYFCFLFVPLLTKTHKKMNVLISISTIAILIFAILFLNNNQN